VRRNKRRKIVDWIQRSEWSAVKRVYTVVVQIWQQTSAGICRISVVRKENKVIENETRYVASTVV
jgi:DNA-directed RNA polymerase